MSTNNANKVKKLDIRRSARAVKACDTCKRLKTKCIPSPLAGEVKCLRCDSFKRHCSFEELFANSRTDSPADLDAQALSGDNGYTDETANPELLKAFLKAGSSSNVMGVNLKYTKMIHNNLLKVLSILEGTMKLSESEENEVSIRKIENGKALSMTSSLVDAVDILAGDNSNREDKLDDSSDGRTTPRNDRNVNECSAPESPVSFFDDLAAGKSQSLRQYASYLSSPYTLMSQLVPKDNLPMLVRKLHDHNFNEIEKPMVDDAVSMNIITLEEAFMLMQHFRDRYVDWCSFPTSISTEKLVNNIRIKNCSLLLTVSCILALRYTDDYHDLKTRCYKNLLLKLRSDLETALRYFPQSKEFIQAIVILSIYASSFSSDFLCVDAWYMSSIGFQHFLTRGVADSMMKTGKVSTKSRSSMHLLNLMMADTSSSLYNSVFEETEEFELLSTSRLWNHLCLCHLNNCIISGRMCTIDEKRLALCKSTLELPQSTNFDGRMVAEISIARVIYNFIQSLDYCDTSNPQPLFDVIKKLKKWLDSWGYLFSQPITQFVEFNYHYGQCVVHYSWYHRCCAQQPFIENSATIISPSSSKTAIADYLNVVYPVIKVIQSMPLEQRQLLLKHAHSGLSTMVNCPFEKFKFLSDHLIFSSVYMALMCLLLLDEVYDVIIDNSRFTEVLTAVKKISQRLHKIREGELKSFWVEEVDLRIPSVILQYHKAIEEYLNDKFGSFQLQVDPQYM